MTNITITEDYNGVAVAFRNDAWLNATAIAEHFGKRVQHYLSSERTQEYIKALSDCFHSKAVKTALVEKQWVIVNRGGNNPGTWLHPKLAKETP